MHCSADSKQDTCKVLQVTILRIIKLGHYDITEFQNYVMNYFVF